MPEWSLVHSHEASESVWAWREATADQWVSSSHHARLRTCISTTRSSTLTPHYEAMLRYGIRLGGRLAGRLSRVSVGPIRTLCTPASQGDTSVLTGIHWRYLPGQKPVLSRPWAMSGILICTSPLTSVTGCFRSRLRSLEHASA